MKAFLLMHEHKDIFYAKGCGFLLKAWPSSGVEDKKGRGGGGGGC